MTMEGLDPVLQQALFDAKLRMFVLRLEQSILHLLHSRHMQNMELDPMNAFYRLLSHKVADYYKIGHMSVGDSGTVVYYKIGNQNGTTRLPNMKLADIDIIAGARANTDTKLNERDASSPSVYLKSSNLKPQSLVPAQPQSQSSPTNSNSSIHIHSHTPHSDSQSPILSGVGGGGGSTILSNNKSSPSLQARKPRILRKFNDSNSAPSSAPDSGHNTDDELVSPGLTSGRTSRESSVIDSPKIGEKDKELRDNSRSSGNSISTALATAVTTTTTTVTSSASSSSSLKGLSFEERVALYEQARARIFQDFIEDPEQAEQRNAEAMIAAATDALQSNENDAPTFESVSATSSGASSSSASSSTKPSTASRFEFNPRSPAFVPR